MMDAKSVVKSDFDEAIAYFKFHDFFPKNPSSDVISVARRVHSSTYGLLLWKFRLTDLPLCATPFLEEIASDALQVLPQVMLGYGKTTKLLCRSILENCLRFIYYYDHPIEFEIMNREHKWYIGVDKLLEYMKMHPKFIEAEAGFDAIARTSSLYSDLSAGIHGRRVVDLEMKTALSKISFSKSAAERETITIQCCSECTNFLLSIQNRAQLQAFTTIDRSIILRSMPPAARRAWRDLPP